MTQANFQVDSISEFLSVADTHYHIFDLSRLVRQIPNAQFAAIEGGQQPFPTPLQQHAWLAIVFWRQHTKQPFIWFAKFPLDERGLLNHAARQHFLQIIVEALGRDLTADTTAEQDELLKQNPYLFTPSEAKRAAFHAQVGQLLEQPPSMYYEDVESFLVGKREPSDWQQLGMQGLHDAATRLQYSPAICRAISEHFSRWPLEFQRQLAAALEHQVLPTHLRDNLIASLVEYCALDTVNSDKAEHVGILLRSLGGTLLALSQPGPATAAEQSTQDSTEATMQRIRLHLRRLLEQDRLLPAQEADILVIIGARCWPLLNDASFRKLFLNRLSHHEGLFSHVFADLVAIPELRIHLLMILRDSDAQSATLRSAFARLQQQLQGRTS